MPVTGHPWVPPPCRYPSAAGPGRRSSTAGTCPRCKRALPPRDRCRRTAQVAMRPPSLIRSLHLLPTRPRMTLNSVQTPNQGDPLPWVRGPYSLGWANLDTVSRVSRVLGRIIGRVLPVLTRHRCPVGPGTSQWPAGARLATERMATTERPSFQSSLRLPKSVPVTGHLGWVTFALTSPGLPTGPNGPSGGRPSQQYEVACTSYCIIAAVAGCSRTSHVSIRYVSARGVPPLASTNLILSRKYVGARRGGRVALKTNDKPNSHSGSLAVFGTSQPSAAALSATARWLWVRLATASATASASANLILRRKYVANR